MASLYKKPVWVTDPKTGQKTKTKSKKWWGRYRDDSGIERRVPLATDKLAAQALLNDLVKNEERKKAGLVDPCEGQRKRPLKEHLADFKKYLQNKNVTPKQVYTATSQIQKMFDSCKWKMIKDISATDALNFLGAQREAGKSAQTYNHYLKSAKQFTRWLVRDRRSAVDALAHLSKLNVSIDRRHDRRALSPEEFQLLVAAAYRGRPIETISGPDRAMMYVLAAWTGFRKGEIGSLTLRSFRLDDEPPTATVAACFSKRKRQDTQILHPEVVRLFRDWVAMKPKLGPDDLLFPISGKVPGGTERKTHKMMHRDLEAARNAWISEASTPLEQTAREQSDFLKYCDDNGLFADFHSNRHLFITSLERANLSPKMAQTLARHSDIRLTLGVYTHVGLQDQSAAIRSLPAPPASVQDTQESASLASSQEKPEKKSRARGQKNAASEVPTVVPSGAENGAILLASPASRIALDGTHSDGNSDQIGIDLSVKTPRNLGQFAQVMTRLH